MFFLNFASPRNRSDSAGAKYRRFEGFGGKSLTAPEGGRAIIGWANFITKREELGSCPLVHIRGGGHLSYAILRLARR